MKWGQMVWKFISVFNAYSLGNITSTPLAPSTSKESKHNPKDNFGGTTGWVFSSYFDKFKATWIRTYHTRLVSLHHGELRRTQYWRLWNPFNLLESRVGTVVRAHTSYQCSIAFILALVMCGMSLLVVHALLSGFSPPEQPT